jgi:tyrosinase
MKLPSRLGLNTSRYDDFTYVHIQVKDQVHHTALSLPWHRLFVSVFEQALTTEGKFDGPLP